MSPEVCLSQLERQACSSRPIFLASERRPSAPYSQQTIRMCACQPGAETLSWKHVNRLLLS